MIDSIRIFALMDYKRIYDTIVQGAKNRQIEGYSEKHHIVPRCVGGDNSKDNLVKLTPKEHYIVHRLLTRIYPENYKLAYAFWSMCYKGKHTSERHVPSPRAYEEARLSMSLATKERLSKSNVWTGRKHSEESRAKQSLSAKARVVDVSVEQIRRNKISSTSTGKVRSVEHCNNISKAKLGENNPMYGVKWKLIDGKRVYYRK